MGFQLYKQDRRRKGVNGSLPKTATSTYSVELEQFLYFVYILPFLPQWKPRLFASHPDPDKPRFA